MKIRIKKLSLKIIKNKTNLKMVKIMIFNKLLLLLLLFYFELSRYYQRRNREIWVIDLNFKGEILGLRKKIRRIIWEK